jgi:hypothetical protein
MHRRAIPSAYLALRLHVFDLYSGMCQFHVYIGTVQYSSLGALVDSNFMQIGFVEQPSQTFDVQFSMLQF